ncbi:glycosyltransferase involved in cell wall biosynthesis [Ruminiclostridium sufflavum DSM 19573]|uniref:Glycosyltransferase involved in cell wall biosynthesis n=1 Tax=Ruminiclostridium sufflavum DSM 19573 TaxID=1121337 RepID=A0A318XJD1_9FIRM|nr:glycosyltransferase family 1 protein [Ruminiclostridium sufflavum]PYG86558.1 glycosyltransferase involved in cell wall biosynthesis [Ruminiclostridium sufflavum DSM 19573]
MKVLYVVPNLRIAHGVASYAMNYYRNIDKEKIHIDFFLLKSIETPYYDEIKNSGGKIYVLPDYKSNLKKAFKYIDCILKEEKHDIIHCNVVNSGIPFLYYAKKNKIPVRILHSHGTKSAEKKWKEIRNNILSPISKHYANTYFACSKMAGDYLFKGKSYTVINNAIDIERFIYNQDIRDSLRKELKVEDKFVLGTVGRLCEQKNPKFAIKVFAELLKTNPNAVYWWIGTGPLDNKIKDYVHRIGIEKSVFFLGNRTDVNQLYQAMDVLFLPSLYEGLPVAGIEGQISGLPMLVSDTVTHEMKITDNVRYITLDKSLDEWVNEIINISKQTNRNLDIQKLIEAGYEIKASTQKLSDKYCDLIKSITIGR